MESYGNGSKAPRAGSVGVVLTGGAVSEPQAELFSRNRQHTVTNVSKVIAIWGVIKSD